MNCPNPNCGSTNCRPNKFFNVPRQGVDQATTILRLKGQPVLAGAIRAAWEGMEFLNSKRHDWHCNSCGAKF